MTDKQKEAIKIINCLLKKEAISEYEYFILLEFIVEEKKEQVTYFPSAPYSPDVIWGSTTSAKTEK